MQWTDQLTDGQIVYACAGSDIDLNFEFSLDPQDQVFSQDWFYNGQLIALESHGAFVALPIPEFQGRVTQTTNAGLHITKVYMFA